MANSELPAAPAAKKLRQSSILSFSSTISTRNTDDCSPAVGKSSAGDEGGSISEKEKGYHDATVTGLIDPADPVNYVGKQMLGDEKLTLLESKFEIPHDFKFPKNAGRRFQPSWMDTRPWLHYSISQDRAYCNYCLCFGISDDQITAFSSTGFKNWEKAVGKKDSYLDQHMRSECHKLAGQKAYDFLKTHRIAGSDINARLHKQSAEQQVRTKRGIMSIIDIVLSLGQRGVAFRGNWDNQTNWEDGNFAFFVNWKSRFDSDIREHIQSAPGNAKYTSPQIQNEIISISEEMIRDNILKHMPVYWSVMADETQDCSTTEQLSVCVRYLNSSYEVCEDFIGFVRMTEMNAQAIADALTSKLLRWGLNMSNLVAQGYDGAAVMSSAKNGVQAKVQAQYPNATYVHCRAHALNLAISSGCKNVPSIRNVFDNVSKLTWFLCWSAKRKEIFLEVAAQDATCHGNDLVNLLIDSGEDELLEKSAMAIKDGSKMTSVPKFCATRWSARVTTLSALLAKYLSVIDSMEMISTKSSGDAKMEASSYVRLLQDPQFITAVSVAQFILSFLGPVTKIMQAKDCSLADAYSDVALAKSCIADTRNNEYWEKLWNRIESVAATANVPMVKPRTANIQRHRANAALDHHATQTASEYYKLNVFYPFIDHVVTELDTRFSSKHDGLISAQNLVPTYLEKLTESQIDSISSYYSKYLLYGENDNIMIEMAKWKKLYEPVPVEDRPCTASLALAESSSQTFPAIHKILTIFLTTPVGSISCERSFSALRRLKLWTRASMAEERLCGLAMMLIHRGTKFIPSPEEVHAKKTNWRKV